MVKLREDAYLSVLYDIAQQKVLNEKNSQSKEELARHNIRLLEAGFNHIVSRSEQWVAKNGGILSSASKSSESGILVAKAHVGRNLAGRPGATNYSSDFTPPGKAGAIKINGNQGVSAMDLESLEIIATNLMNQSIRQAYEGYYLNKSQEISHLGGFEYLPKIVKKHSHSIAPISWKYINVAHANRLASEISYFLKQQPGVIDAIARVTHQDETLRIVSSEDQAVKEWFPGLSFGYQILLEAESGVKEGPKSTKRLYKLADASYTTNLGVFDSIQNSFISNVKEQVQLFAQRSKTLTNRIECPDILPEQDALIWTDSDTTAAIVHEAFTGHTLCSDLLLNEDQQPWVFERFNTKVTSSKISISSRPNLKDKHNLYHHSSYVNDWEGMPGVDKELITRGVLTNYYANRQTAWQANAILKKLGKQASIEPGDSRTGEFFINDFNPPTPRTSTTEITYHGKMPKNHVEMKERFIKEMELAGKDHGYYVALASSGFVEPQGYIQINCPFVYKIDNAGKEQQISGFNIVSFADQMFDNLVVMGNVKKFCAHRCAITSTEEDLSSIDISVYNPSLIRVGMLTRDAIFKNMIVRPLVPHQDYTFR